MKLLRGLATVVLATVALAVGGQAWIWFIHAAMAQGVRDAQPTNHSIKITTGLTYQAIAIPLNDRVSVTFQNNVGNASTDVCYVDITGKVAAGNTTSTNVTVDGVTMTSAQASMTLTNGGSYGRYTVFVPGGVAVVGTCTTTGDAIYVDTQ
jgi:hypothetical protein